MFYGFQQRQRNDDNITKDDGYESLKESAPWLYNYSQALDSLANRTNGETIKHRESSCAEDHEKSEDAHTNGGGSHASWRRPSSDSDRLYMSVGNGDVIEVGHPTSKNEGEDPR